MASEEPFTRRFRECNNEILKRKKEKIEQILCTWGRSEGRHRHLQSVCWKYVRHCVESVWSRCDRQTRYLSSWIRPKSNKMLADQCDLSYGIKIWTDLSSVLSQCMRLTYGQTEFWSLDRACIPRSAVKMIYQVPRPSHCCIQRDI